MTDNEITRKNVQVRLEWDNLDGVESHYINQLIAAYNGNEYYLVFGELSTVFFPDLIKENELLKIKPKVKLVMNKSTMKEIVAVLSDYLEKTQSE